MSRLKRSQSKRSARLMLLGIEVPSWAGRALGAIGVSTILYGLIRYTFIGEFFERLYRDTVGHSPIDDLVDSFDPSKDLEVMKDDMKMMRDALD